MNPKRILCPVDFSECSDAALSAAEQLACQHEAKLYIFHVEVAGYVAPPGHDGYIPEFDEYRRLLDECVPQDADIDFELHYTQGHTVDEIRRFAAIRYIDLIVMGTHGRSGIKRLLMGSVAEQISKHCPCQVMLVPIRATAPSNE